MAALREKLLTVPEVVERFPVPIAEPTIYRWCREGKLSCRRFGGKVFVPESAVDEITSEGTGDGEIIE